MPPGRDQDATPAPPSVPAVPPENLEFAPPSAAPGPEAGARPPRPFGVFGSRVYDGLGLLGGALLAVMTAAVFLQVILRYVFTYSFEGLDEVPRYVFVWLVMIGAAAAMHRGEHTALDYFRNRLSRRGQAVAAIVTHGLGMLLFLSLIKTSFVLVPNSQLQTSAGLGLPLGYVYAAVPVGAALILLPMTWHLAAAVRELRRTP